MNKRVNIQFSIRFLYNSTVYFIITSFDVVVYVVKLIFFMTYDRKAYLSEKTTQSSVAEDGLVAPFPLLSLLRETSI